MLLRRTPVTALHTFCCKITMRNGRKADRKWLLWKTAAREEFSGIAEQFLKAEHFSFQNRHDMDRDFKDALLTPKSKDRVSW